MIAAIYVRKSTEQSGVADDQKSIARQLDHARAYAARRGWTVSDEHVFADDGISGAEFAARPGFVRLMNSLRPRPTFQCLIMSEESRLGREAIETAYALKQLITAGVRVFFYLEDRERTLDSPTDKIMMSLTAFADELEREKARQRVYDAMLRKARAGHVTGGSCFGYRNVEVLAADGRRSHVTREILPDEASVVLRIFDLCSQGWGHKRIAKHLNDQRARAPRSQCGRPAGWAHTTVRALLYNPLYRGEIVWNRTAKRDRWGQRREQPRASSAWLHIPAPHLQIVDDDLWQRAQARLAQARRIHLDATAGMTQGRPGLHTPSKYLLTNYVRCGVCRGPMKVRSRRHGHGKQRKKFYGCSNYHERGRTVCINSADIPLNVTDHAVIAALLDSVLTADVIREAVECAVEVKMSKPAPSDRRAIEKDLRQVDREIERLSQAIAAGGDLPGLLAAVQQREHTRRSLTAALVALTRRSDASARHEPTLRSQLMDIAAEWRQVLQEDVGQARPLIAELLDGSITITPRERKKWVLTGAAKLTGLFEQNVSSLRMASPAGAVPKGIPFKVIVDSHRAGATLAAGG